MTAALVLAAAVVLDDRFGEPPAHLHPVVGMGRLLDRLEPAVPADPPALARRRGLAAWVAGAVVTTAVAAGVDRAARRLPTPAAIGVRATLLWTLFARRMLLDTAAEVGRQVDEDLEAGRAAVGRLVSRDTTALDASQVRAAAIETVAENASDSVVAPLLWFAVAGLPGAALYRWANTADARWGHRTPRWTHAGWAAARLDDAANLVPARLTAALLAGRSVPVGHVAVEAHRTPSPNAGWPMGAVARRLDVRLEKVGSYVLHPAGRPPAAPDVRHAVALVARRTGAFAVTLVGLLAVTRRD